MSTERPSSAVYDSHQPDSSHATLTSADEHTYGVTKASRCLYPGATFRGSQKSGRNRYDASMTIIDVDLASSHLSGHLCIHGLTDEWPELTTYFDAEIIGDQYGFLTRKWGATEREDMVHWGRFPAYGRVKDELEQPDLMRKDAFSHGVVFMRWKEKYVVSDRGTQDIEGASYAGFYYICVDFSSQQTGSYTAMDSVSSAPASLSGFYFHQHSEPYQQLSLVHVPE
ncbi:vacuolar import/degradation protein Vid24 [Cubamyces lactineus]|nr:vacuolar import/degradation protein Vid24 [Cubamyces lactineus]